MEFFEAVQPTVLLVDDTRANLALMSALLRPFYNVKAVNTGLKALMQCQEEPPDLVLLDIEMPDMDGYEVCRQLKKDRLTCMIPVIFLTNKADTASEQLAMEMGAVDYISRPISPPILLSRVHAHFVDSTHARTLRVNNEYLEYEVTKRSRQVTAAQNVTMLALASLAETRDSDTGNHLKRTQGYVGALARALKNHPRFADFLTEPNIDLLIKSAPLHDIGKVGVPDHILLKPGKLTADEWVVMKTHAKLGSDALEAAEKDAEKPLAFLALAKDIAHWHHERWDGGGYPDALMGNAIPISARLMALADVFDALISQRSYKAAMSHAEARAIIIDDRGHHFDPDIVDAVLGVFDEFTAIAQRYSESA